MRILLNSKALCLSRVTFQHRASEDIRLLSTFFLKEPDSVPNEKYAYSYGTQLLLR